MSDTRDGSPDVTGFDRFLRVVILFVVADPPMGLVVLGLGFIFLQGTIIGFADLPAVLTRILPALQSAYLLGIVPAAAAGALIGSYKAIAGNVPWWIALAIGTIIGFSFLYFMDSLRSSLSTPNSLDLGMKLLLILINVLPTMLCWGIAQNWPPVALRATP